MKMRKKIRETLEKKSYVENSLLWLLKDDFKSVRVLQNKERMGQIKHKFEKVHNACMLEEIM